MDMLILNTAGPHHGSPCLRGQPIIKDNLALFSNVYSVSLKQPPLKGTTTHSTVVIRIKNCNTEKTIEIQIVRPTEVRGKV